jgi:octaprenyl-diphosphate synthase
VKQPSLADTLGGIEAVLYSVLPSSADGEANQWINAVCPNLEMSHEAMRHATRALVEPAYDLVRRGGKRWRPLLATLVCGALGGSEQDCLPLTPLVELSHTASLIHDDIEDHSEMRRGEPAIHIKYGEDTGINSGSFLYFLPLRCIDTWNADAEQKNRAYRLWAEHIRRLHLGQALDITWHRHFDTIPEPDEYRAMCGLKTGSLARLAAMLGIFTASIASPRLQKAGDPTKREAALVLGAAAEKLGVGFQILDDVCNLTAGNPGKNRGDDIVEGKKSLPVILYLHAAACAELAARKQRIRRCFQKARENGSDAPEVEECIAYLEASGAITSARRQGEALIEEARSVFMQETCAGIPLDRHYRDLLAELIGSLA